MKEGIKLYVIHLLPSFHHLIDDAMGSMPRVRPIRDLSRHQELFWTSYGRNSWVSKTHSSIQNRTC